MLRLDALHLWINDGQMAAFFVVGLELAAFADPLPLAVGARPATGKLLGLFASVPIADRLGFAMRPADPANAVTGG